MVIPIRFAHAGSKKLYAHKKHLLSGYPDSLHSSGSKKLYAHKKHLLRASKSGETGIRTLGTRLCTTVFETVPFNHSGISPKIFLI